jgi:predicted short-subunit dehydrogenase-like oxidoreductase (DUF2520 family)
MYISIIGAGNVGTHLAIQLAQKTSVKIIEIYSQNFQNALSLTQTISQGTPTNTLDFSKSKATIFLLALKDDIVENVLQKIILPPNAVLLHTSGSHSIDILKLYATHIGVFYPLQTFSKEKKTDFQKVFFCVEANDNFTKQILIDLVNIIGSRIEWINSTERQHLHIAAVIACNFVNHLWTIAEEYLEKHQLSFQILEELLKETLDKALLIQPKNAQTGPAKRKDEKIIQKHLTLLENYPDIKKIYSLLTKSIIEKQ